MACVVSVINLKGGVGKSTLAMILAEYLAFHFHKRVLLIDMDAQANLSYIMAPDGYIETQMRNHQTIYDFFVSALSGQPRGLSEFVASPPLTVSNIKRELVSALGRSRETLDMVISSPEVAQLDEKLLELWEESKPMPKNLPFVLREGLAEIQDQYDIVLIDCPPGLSLFSSTALIASDFFVSPVMPEPLSLKGVELIQKRAARILDRFPDCKVQFAGVILNIVKFFRRTHQVMAERIYGEQRSELNPFTFWLPDSEKLRFLGEFEIDPERIRSGWEGGKFLSVYSKYSVSWLLNNPPAGWSSQTRQVEGEKYRLHERIERLVQEFGEGTGIFV